MAQPREDDFAKASTDGASEFVQAYYSALSSNTRSIPSFYSATPVNILFNGNVVTDGAAVEDIVTQKLAGARYDIHSFDCQIVNKAYPTTTPGKSARANAKNISMMVKVSGSVQYRDNSAPPDDFDETFILIPNTEGKEKNKKDWVIQIQNFRVVAKQQ